MLYDPVAVGRIWGEVDVMKALAFESMLTAEKVLSVPAGIAGKIP
jgi:hypothetical protein